MRSFSLFAALGLVAACHGNSPSAAADPGAAGPTGHFCRLPGSRWFSASGVTVVPGGPDGHDLSYLTVPAGFCVHWFANVGNTRQLRFAPSGELFVASPTTPTTGGGPNGASAIVILPDDDKDGVADAPITYLDNLPSTQGMVFTPGYLYYQDDTFVRRVPYQSGDRAPSGDSTQVANIDIFGDSRHIHWPKTMDIADDGTIYVGNGGDQNDVCGPTNPFHGGILKLDPTAQPMGATPLVRGLRNPVAIQCGRGHGVCFALELARDYSGDQGGREKMIPIRDGDDWGYPCCATQGSAYTDIASPPDCSGVQPETDSFVIGNTPIGMDFDDTGKWPAPWTGNAIVAIHGRVNSWSGAKVVSIGMDPATGLPLPASDLDGQPTGAMQDFATGWDHHDRMYGRPMAVAFANDGRVFIGNDVSGDIVWIAPDTL